jgi:hypothetical protein
MVSKQGVSEPIGRLLRPTRTMHLGQSWVTLAIVGSRLVTIKRACLALAALSMLAGCATLRLSGCARLAQCGALAAYSCEGELVCADADGRTVSAETLIDSHLPCHICSSHARL